MQLHDLHGSQQLSTIVIAVDMLLDGSGSGVVEVTSAVLQIFPFAHEVDYIKNWKHYTHIHILWCIVLSDIV